MVSQALVSAKMASGLGKAAAALGAACPWYRPNGAGNPIVPANLLGSLRAGFQVPNAPYVAPSRYGRPEWWGLFNASAAAIGDYLVEPALGTFFIASLEPIHYPLCVRCNQVIAVGRPGDPAKGANYYGGASAAGLVPIMTGWPAAVMQGTKGEGGEVKLPGDTRLAWTAILLPSVSGVEILPGDWITTSQATPMQYTVSSCELTAMGWRLSAATAVA